MDWLVWQSEWNPWCTNTYVCCLSSYLSRTHRKSLKLTTTIVRLETILFVELTKKVPVFYREGYLLTIITNTYHYTLYSATWIQSTQLHIPYLSPNSSKCLFHIFKSHIRMYVFFIRVHAICPTHLIFFYLITLIMCSKEDKLWHASLCHFLQLLFEPHLSQAPHSLTP